MSDTHNLVARARTYAIQAHSRINHRRKYSLEPYATHLKDVADIVASVSDDAETIAAAWLHDIVEDTPATFLDLEQEFSPTLAQLVSEVTDVSRPVDGNRATRKALDRAHLAKASERGKTVKLADLIDNCQDICSHDPEFAKVYLTEMAALLEVLPGGNSQLYARAVKLMHESAAKLNLPLEIIAEFQSIDRSHTQQYFFHDHASDMFLRTFMARDIARVLPSVDAPACNAAAGIMESHQVPALGLRRNGIIDGYVIREDPVQERTFRTDQFVEHDASFSEVILVLARHNLCFVRMFGAVTAMITREDIQHPFVRMWLFGIITMLEMQTAPLIERLWPHESWLPLVSAGRLTKARLLYEERQRRNQQTTLLGCLQLSDKMQILIENEAILQDFGFPSKKVAKRICKELESLRNNLAHAQDIVTHDFAQIARIAQRIEAGRHA